MDFVVDGHQHCESTGTSNKRLALKILDIRRAEIVEGRYISLVKSKAPALRDCAEQFLKTIRHPNTRRRYACSKVSLDAFFKEARLPHVTVARIEEYKRTRLAAGARSATVNRDLAVLRQLLKRAERERYIARNPFNTADLFLEEKKERRQPHILTYSEETQLLTVAGPMLRTLVVLLVETGLRVGKEALPLEWGNVDLANGAIQVRESKTVAGRRLVPLSDFCQAELCRWRDMTGPAFSGYVFFNERDPATHLLKLPKTWARALTNAKIEYFPIGNLRHTFASRLQEAGASPVTLAQILGHSSTGIIQTYAKVLDEFRRDAIKKLEAYRQSKVAVETAPASTDARIN
jgi:integrase